MNVTTDSDSESFAAKNALTILKLSKEKDSQLARKIDIARNMFDFAYKKNRHDLCEKYRDFENILVITRVFKNSDTKTKRKTKKFFEENALKILKQRWKTDYENFMDYLYLDKEVFFEKFKNNFDEHKDEILFYATAHETSEMIMDKVKKAKNEEEIKTILTIYPQFIPSRNKSNTNKRLYL